MFHQKSNQTIRNKMNDKPETPEEFVRRAVKELRAKFFPEEKQFRSYWGFAFDYANQRSKILLWQRGGYSNGPGLQPHEDKYRIPESEVRSFTVIDEISQFNPRMYDYFRERVFKSRVENLGRFFTPEGLRMPTFADVMRERLATNEPIVPFRGGYTGSKSIVWAWVRVMSLPFFLVSHKRQLIGNYPYVSKAKQALARDLYGIFEPPFKPLQYTNNPFLCRVLTRNGARRKRYWDFQAGIKNTLYAGLNPFRRRQLAQIALERSIQIANHAIDAVNYLVESLKRRETSAQHAERMKHNEAYVNRLIYGNWKHTDDANRDIND